MVTPDDDAMWVDVVGHYDDELVRGADGWRIRRRVTHTPRMLTGGGVPRRRRATGVTEDFAQKYGRWAVIAGASEGVGASLADQLAERGLDLVLIARNEPSLDELAAGVRERHGVEARPLVLDLTDPTSVNGWPRRPTGSKSGCSSTTPVPRTGRWSFSTTRSRTR